ncbi:hypothetical protein ACWEOZ_26605 [Actinoplanes sp. NPDC004185]
MRTDTPSRRAVVVGERLSMSVAGPRGPGVAPRRRVRELQGRREQAGRGVASRAATSGPPGYG